MKASATPEFVGGPRFEVRRRIGAGGFGIVYEVFDKERGAELAIKALARLEAAALYRFKREFRAIADLRHRNLVELHELVSVGTDWILVMELVRGVDAMSWVRPKPRFDKEATTLDLHKPAPNRPISAPGVDYARLRQLLAQLAEGLNALHDAGRLHRDVKPSNVLVEADTERVVIVDFGIATELEAGRDQAPNTDLTLLAGTPEYMAPEQGTGDALTAAADWYAVGVLMFEALTGRLPFVGAPLQILLDKQRFEAPHPSELVKGIPQDLAALCIELLRTRPEMRPKGAEVLRRLGVSKVDSSRTHSGVRTTTTRGDRMLLVGREKELAALGEAFAQTRNGRPTTVVVSGCSGMGKTALVQSYLEGIRDEAIVLTGRCYERESVPYKALDAVIDELSRALLRLPANEAAAVVPRDVAALVRLFPVLQRVSAIAEAPRRALASVDPQQLRLRGFGALRELLARLADRRPLVIFIDDLQWGDVDSAALLAELSAPPDAPCLMLVVSHRTEDAKREVLRLIRENASAKLIPLAPLDREHIRELASALLGDDAPASLVENVTDESRGAPILVRELVDSVQAEGTTFSSTMRLEVLFQNRLNALPDGARKLLQVLAVAGRPLRLEHALAAAALEGDARREALDVLRVARLARSAGTRGSDLAEPYHDRVREAVMRELDPEMHRDTHAAIARALRSTGGQDPEAMFTHWSAAGQPELALEYAEEAAAKAARALAFDRAAQFYEHALDLVSDQRRVVYAEARADALANAGRGAEAADAYLAAAELKSGLARLDLERRAGEQLLVSGHVDRGLELMGRVFDQLGLRMARSPRMALLFLVALRVWVVIRGLGYKEADPATVPPKTLTRIDVAWSTAVGLSVVDNIRAAHLQTRSLLLCLSAGEPTRLLRALMLEAIFVSVHGAGRYPRALEIVEECRRLAARHPSIEASAFVDLADASTSYFSGRWSHAIERVEKFLAHYHEGALRLQWELRSIQYFGLCARLYRGDLEGLHQRLPAYLREAQERGDLYFSTNLYVGETNMHWLFADEPEEARRVVDEAMKRWSKGTMQVQHWYALQSLAQIDLYTGNSANTLERVERLLPAVKRSMLLRVQHTRVKARWLHARCAIAAGQLSSAEKDARALEREDAPWAFGFGSAIRAGVAAARGADPNAYLRAAIDRFEAAEMPLFAACVRVQLGDPEGEKWLRARGVKAPEKLARMIVPGPFAPRR